MKKVLLVFTKTEGAYVGGVLSIINHYLANEKEFVSHGYGIEHYNYQPGRQKLFHKLPNKIKNVVYGLLQRGALSRRLRKEPADIVHIHTSREFLFLKDMIVAKHIARKNRAKVAMTIHVGAYETVFKRIRFAEKWCMKALNRYVEKVVFLSDVMKKEFEEKGLDRSRTELIYNFHNLPIASDMVKEEGALHLLFVGAIHREKGILELLRALESIDDPNVTLDVCGMLTDQSIREEFEALVARLGDRVKLNGYVSGEAKSAIFQRAHVLILPSYHEGFPLVILEGLAAGCALISTQVGSTPEVLSEENVKWVGIGSAEDIAQAIGQYRADPALLKATQAANLKLSDAFTLKANVGKTCRMFDAMLR